MTMTEPDKAAIREEVLGKLFDVVYNSNIFNSDEFEAVTVEAGLRWMCLHDDDGPECGFLNTPEAMYCAECHTANPDDPRPKILELEAMRQELRDMRTKETNDHADV